MLAATTKRWRVLLLAGVVACAGTPVADGGQRQVLTGVVSDLRSQPVAGAVVTLCELEPDETASVNVEAVGCRREIALATAEDDGRFELAWQGPAADLASASLVVRQPTYATRSIAAADFVQHRTITLEKAAVIHARFVRADQAAPIGDAEYGYFYQDGRVLRIRHVECCSTAEGKLELAFDHRPDSTVWLFAIDRATSSYALKEVSIKPELDETIELKVAAALRVVHGRVVAADGEPIAGAVAVRSSAGDQSFDRVLALLDGDSTSVDGQFRVRRASPGAFSVEFFAWKAGDGTRLTHVARKQLVVSEVSAEAVDVVLRVPNEKIVACSLVTDAGTALPIDELGLTFGPHRGWGHSDGCVSLRPPVSASSAPPSAVRFVWPEQAESVVVEARASAPEGLSGTAQIHASDTCRIRASDE